MGALWNLLEKQSQLHTGIHFVYTGDDHVDGYVNNRFLGEEEFEPELRKFAFRLLTKAIKQGGVDRTKPILIVGIETLGADLAEVAAEEYNERCVGYPRIRHATIEYNKLPDASKEFFWSPDNPGINHLCTPDTQVIWMDDLLNASSTLQRTRKIIEAFVPIMVVAVLFDRSNFTANDLGVSKLVSLEKRYMPRFKPGPKTCPGCRDKLPIVTNLGHGAAFQAKHKNYPGGFTTV